MKETQTIWPQPKSKGTGFGACPSDTLGGDPVEQCTAWMDVGEGEVARETLPHYDSSLGTANGSVGQVHGAVQGKGSLPQTNGHSAILVNGVK